MTGKNMKFVCLFMAILAVISITLHLAPRLAPGLVVRYSPIYGQVFDVYCSGRCESAIERLERDAPDNIIFLCDILSSGNITERQKTALLISLSTFQSEKLTNCMIQALKDPNIDVRIFSAVGLALRGLTEALPDLVTAHDVAQDEEERRQLHNCIEELELIKK